MQQKLQMQKMQIFQFVYFYKSDFYQTHLSLDINPKVLINQKRIMNNTQQVNRVKPQQLIDGDKHFNRQALSSLEEELKNVQKDYQSVAIIGVQNSGKSTLLNNLFGTNFQVLQKTAGQRTTMGIWTSLDQSANILVMDVQGNDAQKRANDQQYEKMVSTFALVQADTLIINIWSKTLGQYTGSQYQTLTAVLDICISQFKQQSPKTLLFCVRDFNEDQDEEGEIRRKIVKDVNKIWQKIQKPPEIAKYQSTPQKFFVVEVAVLRAFKKVNPKYFLEDVKKLRQRFINPKVDGYVFKSKKTAFNLPFQDLPQLAENSWNSILTNKKLNLPNEKEQLSNFRCSDILNEELTQFKSQIEKIEKAKNPVDFGKLANHFIQQFEAKTYNYGKHIVEEKEKVLKQQINDTIERVINEFLDFEEQKLKDQFRVLSSEINETNSKTLEDRLNEIKNEIVEKYSQYFKILNYEVQQRKNKIEKLSAFLQKENVQSMTKMKEIIKAEFATQSSREMRLLSSELLKKYFGEDFWKNVQHQYTAKRHQLIQKYEDKVIWAQNRVLEPAQMDKIDEQLSTQLRNILQEEFKKSLMGRVFDIFLKEFTKNHEGVPYNFNILDLNKITELYEIAREKVKHLVDSINLYNVRRSKKSTILEFDENEGDEFFENTWLSTSMNDLDKKMIAEHETIVRRKKEDEMRRVPAWLIAIIIYFVYDDLWFPQDTHPITNKFLTFFLIFVAFFFSIGQHRAFMELWNLAVEIISKGIEKGKQKLGNQP